MSLCLLAGNCSVNSPKFGTVLPAVETSESALDINTATSAEFEKLPHIGAKTAAKIIEHRTRFGKFRRPEHLLLVSGISDERFRKIRSLIKVNGKK